MTVAPSPAANPQNFDATRLTATLDQRFRPAVAASKSGDGQFDREFLVTEAEALPALAKFLFWEAGCSFGGLIVEERD
ncbi:MAG: hypothetical protein ACRD3W_29310 [Terriglobales bacterium]